MEALRFNSPQQLRAHYDAITLRLSSKVAFQAAPRQRQWRELKEQHDAHARAWNHYVFYGVDLGCQSDAHVKAWRKAPCRITYQSIISAAARVGDVKPADILSPSRSLKISLPRHLAMYIMATNTTASTSQIGFRLGSRDHTTAIYGRDKIARLLSTDKKIAAMVHAIRVEIGAIAP